MNFFKENFPFITFIVAYLISKDLLISAGAWSCASLIQISSALIMKKPVTPSHWLFFAIGLIMLASAYWLKDPEIIQWKTSVIVWLFAAFFLLKPLFTKDYVITSMLQKQQLLKESPPASISRKINWLWIVGFTFFGGLNIYIAQNFSTDFWFYFKIGGLFLMTICLFIISVIACKDYLVFEEEGNDSDNAA